VLFLVVALAIGYLVVTRRPGPAILLVVAVGGGQILSSVLKLGFARVRPDLVPHSVDVYTASFPSGHAMLSAVTYLTLGAILASVEPRRGRRLYVIGAAVFLTVLIGGSRVYLGVHWPTDVLAGWCIGAAWAVFCWTASVLVLRRFGRGPAEHLPAEGVSPMVAAKEARMARPGMTEGTSDEAAPEAVRLDVDPGRNVGTAELAAGPAPAPAAAREEVAAAQRREMSPPSYQGPEQITERPWPAMALVAVVVVVIAAAVVFYMV
jgi:hypothetical protein